MVRLHPVCKRSDNGRRTQRQELADVADRVPAQLDKANAADWVEAALANGVHGVATVVFHSIVWQYLASEDCASVRWHRQGRPLLLTSHLPGSDLNLAEIVLKSACDSGLVGKTGCSLGPDFTGRRCFGLSARIEIWASSGQLSAPWTLARNGLRGAQWMISPKPTSGQRR
jgi:hypothetical protein